MVLKNKSIIALRIYVPIVLFKKNFPQRDTLDVSELFFSEMLLLMPLITFRRWISDNCQSFVGVDEAVEK